MIDDKGGRYEKFRKSDEDIAAIKSRKVREFYVQQNEILVRWGTLFTDA